MNAILNSPDEYRGYFISQFSELENVVDMFTADHFIPDNEYWAHELIEILIDRIPFESKRTALKIVLERKAVTDKITKGTFTSKSIHKKILEDIRRLAHVRNYFAHYKIVRMKTLT